MFKLKTNEEFSDKLKNKIIAESKGFELISFKNPNKNTFVTEFNINVNFLDQLKYKDSLTKYFVTPQLFQNIEELLVSNCSEDVFFEKIILLNNSFLEDTFSNTIENESNVCVSTKAVNNALKYAEKIIIKSIRKSEFISRVLKMKGKELFIEIYEDGSKDFMKFGLLQNNKIICVIEFNCSLLSFQEKTTTLDFTIQIANINKGIFSFFDNCFKGTVEEKMLRKSISSYQQTTRKFHFKNKKIIIDKFLNSKFDKSMNFINSKTIEYNFIFNMIISAEFNKRIFIGNEDEKQIEFENNYFIDLVLGTKFIKILYYVQKEFTTLKSKKIKFYFKIDPKSESCQIIFDNKNSESIYVNIVGCEPIDKIPLSFAGKETMFYIDDFVEHGNDIIEYIKITQY